MRNDNDILYSDASELENLNGIVSFEETDSAEKETISSILDSLPLPDRDAQLPETNNSDLPLNRLNDETTVSAGENVAVARTGNDFMVSVEIPEPPFRDIPQDDGSNLSNVGDGAEIIVDDSVDTDYELRSIKGSDGSAPYADSDEKEADVFVTVEEDGNVVKVAAKVIVPDTSTKEIYVCDSGSVSLVKFVIIE